jgi:two-component sensor histidine kinase/GAF domain-containing protein
VSLRNTILLAFLVISLPLVAVNAWWMASQQNREYRRVLERLRQDAEQAARLTQVFLTDMADRAQQTAQTMQANGGARAYLLDRLQYLQFWNSGITGLAWVDTAGRIFVGEPTSVSRSDARFVEGGALQALQPGKDWALDGLVLDEERGTEHRVLRLAARGLKGTPQGVAEILFAAEVFRPLFSADRPWSQIRVADQAGRLVYATDKPQPSVDERSGWADASGLREAREKDVAIVREARMSVDGAQVDWMFAHVPIPRTGWVASAVIPAADAMAQSRRVLYGEVAIQSILVMVCTVAALILAHRTAQPARRLAAAAQRIAGGDRRTRVGLSGQDEIAAAGRAFDEMAEALDASWATLRTQRDAAENVAARLATLSRLANLASASLDTTRVFNFIAEATSHLLDGAVVLLLVGDEEHGTLNMRASYATTRPELQVQNQYRSGEGLIGWVFKRREPLVLADMLADGRTLNRAWVEAERLRAFAGVPLLLGDRCLGVLYAARSGDRPFLGDDVELLKSFAAHAATSIQNAQLYKRAELEAERLRAVLESMPAAVLVGEGRTGGDAIRLVMANGALAELDAVSALTPSARTAEYETLRADGSAVADKDLPLQRAIWYGEETKGEELIVRFADGRQRSLLINAVPLPEQGGTRQAVSMILDITERRRAEEELKRLAADNAALYERAAQEAKIKGILLDELNHRVRNNLALIIGFLELQRAIPDDRQAATAIEDVAGRVKGLAMVHDILGGADSRFGQYEALVHRLGRQTLLQGPLEGRVKLDVEIQPLYLPPRELTALGIVTNELFTNIAKHAFPEGRRGTVRVTAETPPGEIIVRVWDSGVGLPPGFGGGAGQLGLRLVQTLVEVSLKGRFAIEGGNGTTAAIRFPIPEEDLEVLDLVGASTDQLPTVARREGCQTA